MGADSQIPILMKKYWFFKYLICTNILFSPHNLAVFGVQERQLNFAKLFVLSLTCLQILNQDSEIIYYAYGMIAKLFAYYLLTWKAKWLVSK